MKNILKFGMFTLAISLVACSNDDAKIIEMQTRMIKQQEMMIINLKEELANLKNEIPEPKGQPKGNAPKNSCPPFFARGKGMFPEGSERRLTNDDVYNLSPGELKIMRNEIFARHGFIFKTNDMKKHFSTQPWYKPLCDNVTNMLSKIEQDNVNFIRLYE